MQVFDSELFLKSKLKYLQYMISVFEIKQQILNKYYNQYQFLKDL